jgi:hypothetical protein
MRDVPHSSRLAVSGLTGVPLGLAAAGAEGDYSAGERVRNGAMMAAVPAVLFGGYGMIGSRAIAAGLREMGRVTPFTGKKFRQARDRLARILRREGQDAMAWEVERSNNLEEAASVFLQRDPRGRQQPREIQQALLNEMMERGSLF